MIWYNLNRVRKKNLPEKLENFFLSCEKVSFKKRAVIFRPEDKISYLFYLKKGYVRVYSVSKEGEELTLFIFQPNEFFPLQWNSVPILSEHFYETITPIEVYRASHKDFIKFMQKNPDILFGIVHSMIALFYRILNRMENLVFGNSYEKIVSILLLFAKTLGKKEGRKTILQVPLTHKDIAALVGMTRETASLELEKLQKKGVISHVNHLFFIKNIKKLQKEIK